MAKCINGKYVKGLAPGPANHQFCTVHKHIVNITTKEVVVEASAPAAKQAAAKYAASSAKAGPAGR
ncbi:MAG TPA: hypothetical protein VD997_04160 [Phycisphaerales bacterium]|nr:hypothetical protein [Phycisphaerales bacterium]